MSCQGMTDKGLKRQNNQDSFRIIENKHYTLAVVCDGMGGARGGSVASKIAAETFAKQVKERLAKVDFERMTTGDYERLLIGALNSANTAVYEKACTSDDLEGMGTTLVGFLNAGNRTYAVNTGDSRLYISYRGITEQITHDHSFVQYLVNIGRITPEQAEHHPQKNIILKVVGVDEQTECDFHTIDDFDSMLLCSDGLTNMITKDELSNILNSDLDETAKAKAFIDLANERGGTDNITAVVFRRK